MEKSELIRLLITDVKTFNNYRAQNPEVVINLSDANLSYVDLSRVNLRGVDLSYSNLRSADLRSTDLSRGNLIGSNLSYANLRGANLRNANLTNADLRNADLTNADLRNANLTNADLDFCSMPLCCGDLKAGYDDKQIIQQLYHVLSHIKHSNNVSDEIKELLSDKNLEWANKFHRIKECGKL